MFDLPGGQTRCMSGLPETDVARVQRLRYTRSTGLWSLYWRDRISRLFRLSHSVQHLINLGTNLHTQAIGLHVIEQGIDTAVTHPISAP